jgi:hypothetical protein
MITSKIIQLLPLGFSIKATLLDMLLMNQALIDRAVAALILDGLDKVDL